MSAPYTFPPLVSTAYTNTTTSYSTIGGLTTPTLAPGGTYRMTGGGQWSFDSIATTVPTLAFTLAASGISSPSILAYRFTAQNNANGTTVTEAFTAFSVASPTAITPNAAAQYAWWLDAIVQVGSTGGTISVQAKLPTTGSHTLTIATGSTILVDQIA